MERMKYRTYSGVHANVYFWRSYSQQEIDLVEEREGRLVGLDCYSDGHCGQVRYAGS